VDWIDNAFHIPGQYRKAPGCRLSLLTKHHTRHPTIKAGWNQFTDYKETNTKGFIWVT
jgi:hypothetical protein